MVVRIAPSLLGSDFDRLEDEVKAIVSAGADLLHIDVMDGKFVGNISVFLDASVTARVKAVSSGVPLDVHLMVQDPLNYIDSFVSAGADLISVHVEADDFLSAIEKIKGHGKKAGIVLNPATAVEEVFPFLEKVDFVLVMSVVPGKGGQSYIEETNAKINFLRQEILTKGLNVFIEVDGGIKQENSYLPFNAGADTLVVGTGIFSKDDYSMVIKSLKNILYVGADHAGWEMKEKLKESLTSQKIAFSDLNGLYDEKDDYPHIAHAVGEAVVASSGKGLLVCGSGTGVSIAANKVNGVRSAPLLTEKRVRLAREHNNLNVLCLPGRDFSLEDAQKIVAVFLETSFEGGRHERRVKQIEH
jgi:ribulose-phosphate 3-epimerase